MSCTHPLIGLPTGNLTVNGKPDYKIVSSSSLLFKEDFHNLEKNYPGAILIPCGKCIDCRLDYSRRWADRMMLELATSKKAIFLTLTYDDVHIHPSTWKNVVPDPAFYFPGSSPHVVFNDDGTISVPEYYTLCKRDCQLFMKRLRRAFPDLRIRFYLAGEYGDKTLRPHYHCILYGLSVDDFFLCDRGVMCYECSVDYSYYKGHCDKFMIKVYAGNNELGDKYFISPMLSRIWGNGFVYFSDVTWRTCAYVARYVTKKVGGDLESSYQIRNCEKEFSLMSRRPGIGAQYLLDHPDCLDYNSINLPVEDGAVKVNLPSYFLRIGDLSFPEKCAIIKERRKEVSIEALKLHLKNTTLQHLDYLEVKDQIKKESVKSLKRVQL